MSEQYAAQSQDFTQFNQTIQSFQELATRVLPRTLRGSATCVTDAPPVHGEYPAERTLRFTGSRRTDEHGSYPYFELRDKVAFGHLEPEQFDRQIRRHVLSNQDPELYRELCGPNELRALVVQTYELGRDFSAKHKVTYERDGERVRIPSTAVRVLHLDGSSTYEQEDALQTVFDEMSMRSGIGENVEFFAGLQRDIDSEEQWRPALRLLVEAATGGEADEATHMQRARMTAREMLARYTEL